MVDTRCYKCVTDANELHDIENFGNYIFYPKYSNMEYQGNGIFECPRCSDILDLSTKTHTTKISRKYDEDGSLYTEFLQHDEKLINSKGGVEQFEDDMIELDIFDDIPWGTYVLEVLWYYYECGVMEGPEWDVKIEILSETEVKEK